MEDSERRASKRTTYFCEATLEGMDVAHTHVRLADLSVEGAFVDTRSVLPAGAVTRLRFTLGSKDVGVNAEVRYSMPGMGMGLRFLNLAPEDRKAIEEFLARQA